MKKMLASSVAFALGLVLVAGVIAVSSQPAGADQCVLADSPFVYYGSACKPEPGTKQGGKYDYVRMYVCLGYSASYGTPCLCTYMGCVRDPYHYPPNEPDV